MTSRMQWLAGLSAVVIIATTPAAIHGQSRGAFVRVTTVSDSVQSGYFWSLDSSAIVLQPHQRSTLLSPNKIAASLVKKLEVRRGKGRTLHSEVYGMGGFFLGALIGYVGASGEPLVFLVTSPAAGILGAYAGVLRARARTPYQWETVSPFAAK